MRSRQYGNGLNTEHCRHGGSSQNRGGKSWKVCRTMKPTRSKFPVLDAEFCSGDPFRHPRPRNDGRHRGRIREFHPRRHRALCPPYAGDRRRNRVRLPDPLQYTHVVRDRGAAHIENPAELGTRNLHVAGLAAKLHGGKRVHQRSSPDSDDHQGQAPTGGRVLQHQVRGPADGHAVRQRSRAPVRPPVGRRRRCARRAPDGCPCRRR